MPLDGFLVNKNTGSSVQISSEVTNEFIYIFWQDVQRKIDLIDMRHMPDGSYHDIAHYMDH